MFEISVFDLMIRGGSGWEMNLIHPKNRLKIMCQNVVSSFVWFYLKINFSTAISTFDEISNRYDFE